MPSIANNIAEQDNLLRVIDTSLEEITGSMRAVLCWSTLLLSEKVQDSILMDLEIIVSEAAQVNEIIRGLKHLEEKEGQK